MQFYHRLLRLLSYRQYRGTNYKLDDLFLWIFWSSFKIIFLENLFCCSVISKCNPFWVQLLLLHPTKQCDSAWLCNCCPETHWLGRGGRGGEGRGGEGRGGEGRGGEGRGGEGRGGEGRGGEGWGGVGWGGEGRGGEGRGGEGRG